MNLEESDGQEQAHHHQVKQEERCPSSERSPTRRNTTIAASSDGTPNSSPQKRADSSSPSPPPSPPPPPPCENSCLPGYSPVALGVANSQQGGEIMGEYPQENDNDEYYEERNESASAFSVATTSELGAAVEESSQVSQEASSTVPQQNDNNKEKCNEEEAADEELIFEESSYGDEIARWMEDVRNLQQQTRQRIAYSKARKAAEENNENNKTDPNPTDSEISSNPSSPKKPTPKRRHRSNPSSPQKPSSKRPRSHSTSLSAAPPTAKSASRIRMDNALRERSQSQIQLRTALLALKKAEATVLACRSRYNAAKALVQDTAKDECDSLLREDTPWNFMFHKLKQYKDDAGDCNVKQNFGAEDNRNSPMVRRLSAWVGKNRKDGKLRGRGLAAGSVPPSGGGARRMQEGKASEESDGEGSAAVPVADRTGDETVVDASAAAACGDVILPKEDHRGDDDDTSVFDDVDPDSIHADPYKEIALDGIAFDWNPRNSRWLQMYEELRRYKEEHDNTLVPHFSSGLGAWVKRQQVQYTLYSKGTKSDLSEVRVSMLNDLGFIWSRRTNTWNENFERLTKWNEIHGSFHIPDDSKDPEVAALSKWVADQRWYYKRQIADEEGNCSDDANATEKKDRDEKTCGSSDGNNSTEKKDCDEKTNGSSDGNNATKKKSKRKLPKLSHEQIAKLRSIGFEFDSRDAKWLQKLDVLLKYKQSHGDFLVPSNYPEDPTLSNWVQSQRAQHKLHIKGKKSNLTERRLKILTDAGFPFSVNRQKVRKEAAHQDRIIFTAKPWLEKYKDFLLYIAAVGSLENIQKNYPFLAEWAAKQGEGPSSPECATSVNDKDENQLMEAARFFLFCQSNKGNVLLLRGKNNAEPTAVIKEESSWDDQFGNLAAWYIKHGTYLPRGMPVRLKKFMSNTLQQHRLFTSGIDSELTSERIEKLKDIYFPFDKASMKEPRDDDTAAPRRNRSWEEYRLDLAISYIQKGTFDSNSLDDVELRRWAAEQKRRHKLYMAGKQTALTFAQIQNLMDIRFISKRPKQKSWVENCADLMAFRIQFGTFDVASAHVVTNAKGAQSKGRSANSCTNNTALKNLQEWVVKLQGHYCESSKSVTVNEELTQDQKMKLDSAGFSWTGSGAISGELAENVSCSFKQLEKTDTTPAEYSASAAPIKSNLFGMTLEMQQVPNQT